MKRSPGGSNPAVIHVVEAAAVPGESPSDPAMRAIGALVRRTADRFAHSVIVIGGSGARRAAYAAGLKAQAAMGAPLSCPALAWRGMRRRLNRMDGPAIVHAWSNRALTLSALAAWHRPDLRLAGTVSWSVPRVATGLGARLEEWAIQSADALIAMDESDARLATEIAGQGRVSLRSWPAPPRPGERARESLRAEWGIDETTIVIYGAGEPSELVDAKRVAYETGLLAVSGRAAAAIVPSRARDLERALRFTERHDGRWRLIVEDRKPWDVLPGCDLAVWCGDRPTSTGKRLRGELGAEGLSIALEMGVPIVADDLPRARAVVQARSGHPQEALLTAPNDALPMNRAIYSIVHRLEQSGRAHTAPRAAARTSEEAWAGSIAPIYETLARSARVLR